MASLLEMKRMGCEWRTAIFPIDTIPWEHLEIDELSNILRLICQELSDLYPGDLFMPHLVADVVIGALDQDDFNANKWEEIKDTNYELVIETCSLIFQAMENFGNVELVSVDEMALTIQYQLSPKENY